MKRIIGIIIISSMIICTLIGCGSNKNEISEKWISTDLNETASLGNISFSETKEWNPTLNKTSDGIYYYPYADGGNNGLIYVSFTEYFSEIEDDPTKAFKDFIIGTAGSDDKMEAFETINVDGLIGARAKVKLDINDSIYEAYEYVFTDEEYVYAFIFGDKNKLSNNMIKASEIIISSVQYTKPVEQEIEISDRDKLYNNIMDLCKEGLVYTSGNYAKGDISVGEYAFIRLSSSAYYEESDSAGNIIANENFDSFGYVYVNGTGNIETNSMLINVNAFEQLGVSGAKEIYEKLNYKENYNEGGYYKVGLDIAPGNYTIESMGDYGYYAVVSGPVGKSSIINNDNINGRSSVYLSAGQYLELSSAIVNAQ